MTNIRASVRYLTKFEPFSNEITIRTTVKGIVRYENVQIKITPNQAIEYVVDKLCLKGNYALVLHKLPYKIIAQDMDTPFVSLQFFHACLSIGFLPQFEMVPIVLTNKYFDVTTFGKHIDKLNGIYDIIGEEYKDVIKLGREETQIFRTKLTQIRLEEENNYFNKYEKTLLEENEFVYVDSEPEINENENIKFSASYVEAKMEKVFMFPANTTIKEIIHQVYEKMKNICQDGLFGDLTEEQLVIKVKGTYEFLIPTKIDGTDYKLGDFDYIRNCVHTKQKVELILYPREKLWTNILKDKALIRFQSYFDFFVANDTGLVKENKDGSLSQKDLTIPYFIMLNACENVAYFKPSKLKEKDSEDLDIILQSGFKVYFAADLYYGPKKLSKTKFSKIYDVEEGVVLFKNENPEITFDININKLPRETKLMLTMYMTEKNKQITDIGKKDICIATTNIKVVDYHNNLCSGEQFVYMWEKVQPNFIAMCCGNVTSLSPKLSFSYPTFNTDVHMDTFVCTEEEINEGLKPITNPSAEETKIFKTAVVVDPMTQLSEDTIQILWKFRTLVLKGQNKALSRLVNAVDFTDREKVIELYKLLDKWPLLEPHVAIELLDFKYPDQNVRQFALKCLDTMKDNELVDFLPQLIQALKFELHHSSHLAVFLLRRAIKNKNRIGHMFFWFLKAELHDSRVTERYGALLEAFLNGCGNYRNELMNQVKFQNQLVSIANEVKKIPERDYQKVHLKKKLSELTYPDEMSLPIDSRFRITKPVPNTGHVFSSKKKPLMLVLQNVDPLGEDIMVIQKVGDDLRQDILTLQMLRLMYSIWKKAGLDFRMSPYQCIATGNEIGMLELVKNAETYGAIIAADGRKLAVTKEDVLTRWLQKQNPNEEDYKKAVENFIYSCAGYCVATYILGIGDRHSDNVMIKRDGHFFHIDFGHFLGNFKSKFGIKRERTPFKFTIHFAHVMGGKDSENFKKFEELCVSGLECLRKKGSLFIYLFRLMLATGIPELQSDKDIEYMKDMFMFDKTQAEVKKAFKKLIHECLDAKSQTFNDFIHDFVHY